MGVKAAYLIHFISECYSCWRKVTAVSFHISFTDIHGLFGSSSAVVHIDKHLSWKDHICADLHDLDPSKSDSAETMCDDEGGCQTVHLTQQLTTTCLPSTVQLCQQVSCLTILDVKMQTIGAGGQRHQCTQTFWMDFNARSASLWHSKIGAILASRTDHSTWMWCRLTN